MAYTILDQARPIMGSPVTASAPAAVTSVTSSTTLLAANAARRGFVVVNDSTATLYAKFGSTASTTSYTYKLLAGDSFESMITPYSGIITGIWAAANGQAMVTELT